MQRQRKSPRFLVGPNFPLTAHIPQSSSKIHKLRTIGTNGVGFYASNRDAKLLQSGQVDIHLTLGGAKIQLKGKIQYCQFLPKSAVNFLGVEFLDCDQRTNLIIKTLLEGALQKGHLIIT